MILNFFSDQVILWSSGSKPNLLTVVSKPGMAELVKKLERGSSEQSWESDTELTQNDGQGFSASGSALNGPSRLSFQALSCHHYTVTGLEIKGQLLQSHLYRLKLIWSRPGGCRNILIDFHFQKKPFPMQPLYMFLQNSTFFEYYCVWQIWQNG